jgi:cellulose synthase/poly-beta-1,6-N-acetylglucosamine synthase-like glycosyltransferase
MTIQSFILLALTLLLGIPVIWFFMQIALALLPSRRAKSNAIAGAIRTTVLIPAHNESIHLLPTLRALLNDKNESIRVLVVADNCTDDTAAVARLEGVEVIERTNATLRGKGYALDFGIQHLQSCSPQVLVVLDADCLPVPGAVEQIAKLAWATARPVQALYLMDNKDKPALKEKIAAFAWLVKNQVRPRGLHRMNLPCQLTGSGMAFPWQTLRGVCLATGSIVEDMKLGLELTALGHPPLFSELTVVRSSFPVSEEGVKTQRTRWEHGHLSMLLNEGLPKLLKGAVQRDSALFFLALDLCIPPLALLVLGLFGWATVSGIFWLLSGNAVPLALSAAYLLLVALGVVLSWSKFGRAVVTGTELMRVPLYILAKVPVYTSYLFRRQAQWVRSKRDGETK